MSEPTLTIDHQATLQPSPTAVPPTPPAGIPLANSAQTAPIDQYQPPASSPVNSTPSTQSAPPVTAPAPPTPANVPMENIPVPADAFPGVAKPIMEEVVVEWTAPSRPHKQRQKKYFTTVAVFTALLALILFFLNQFLLIGVVFAIVFLVYVLEMVPPGMVTYQVTTFGIRVEKTLYYWEELGFFWFAQRYGQKMLHVEVGRFPWRLTLMLGTIPEEAMKELLSQVLVNHQPAPTTFEKISHQLQRLIPLEQEQPLP